MRVRSHHIRKLLGHPSEQIFTNVDEMIAARKAAKHQFWKKKQKQQPSAVSAEDGASSDSASSGDTARKMLQTQLSREDQEEEIVNFLDDFRANLMEGDDVEVAVIEGVPSRKNSFRRAICARVPGNFCNKTTNLSYGYIYIITYIYTYISSYVSLCPLRLTLTTYLNTAKRMFLCHHTYQVNLKIHLMYCIWMAP